MRGTFDLFVSVSFRDGVVSLRACGLVICVFLQQIAELKVMYFDIMTADYIGIGILCLCAVLVRIEGLGLGRAM